MQHGELVRGFQVSARAAVAAGLSVIIAELLGLQFPIFAMISAVVVSDLSPVETRRLGLPRLAGTVVGAVAGGVLSPLLPAGAVATMIGILAASFITHALRLPKAAKVAGYVCGIVLLERLTDPWAYAWYRFVETALGIGMAVLVSLVPRLISIDESESAGVTG